MEKQKALALKSGIRVQHKDLGPCIVVSVQFQRGVFLRPLSTAGIKAIEAFEGSKGGGEVMETDFKKISDVA